MKEKSIWPVFWAMAGTLVVVFGLMVTRPRPPAPAEIHLLVLLVSLAIFLVLGLTLLVLAAKTKVRGMLRGFLVLTGASPVVMFGSVLLHNAISGLAHSEEPVFFLIAVLVCPVAFLVGATGSVVLKAKESR